MPALLGYKLGMTRVFDEAGRSHAVTAVQAGPCIVTALKTVARDGYDAVQIGIGEKRHPNAPLKGQTKMLGITPQHKVEFRGRFDAPLSLGDTVDISSFAGGDRVRITATSKGKGFAGVIKRHNFSRGPETHGSDHHRAPGSIGAMFPQHVTKGRGMPGRMGNERVTVRKVQVMEVFADQGVLLVKGPVPGSRGSLVQLSTM